MLSSLTAHDLFSQILLLRSADNRTIILVEGESDCAVIDSHLDVAECDSLPAHSKDNAVGAAILAADAGFYDVLALVDRDWVGKLEQPLPYGNIFYTDAYDMESTFFAKPHLQRRLVNSYSRRDLRVSASNLAAALRAASDARNLANRRHRDMSALSRELDRHIAFLKQLVAELQVAVTDLERDVQTHRAAGHDGWTTEEADAISRAVIDWGDNCAQTLAVARGEVNEFRRALLDAARPERGW